MKLETHLPQQHVIVGNPDNIDGSVREVHALR